MGNQQSSNDKSNNNLQAKMFENSSMIKMHRIQKATLIKCILPQNTSSERSVLYCLQKYYSCSSQQQYKLLQRLIQCQCLSSTCLNYPLLKMLKTTSHSQSTFCSSKYLTKVLFQYSDITMRIQIRSRSRQRQYFRYEDLCNVMFGCVGALLMVDKIKQQLNFIVNKYNAKIQFVSPQLDYLMEQTKYSLPINLDRIVLMADGTIKILNPLVLDHQSRHKHSDRFFYSPQKMKDFMAEDGINGRLFQIGLVVLQCALLESTEQMNKIYNGYCINQTVLSQKIQKAINIYQQRQQFMTCNQMNLFRMIQKMTRISSSERINLQQSIYLAEKLFQANKVLKQSLGYTQNKKPNVKIQNLQRMKMEQLQDPYKQRIYPKQIISTVQPAYSKIKNTQQKTTAGRMSEKLLKKDNIKIQTTIFQLPPNQIKIQSTRQNTSCQVGSKQSLQINNDKVNIGDNIKQLIGKESYLYNTNKFYKDQSQYDYNKYYSFLQSTKQKSQIKQNQQTKANQVQLHNNVQHKRQLKYKQLLNRSKEQYHVKQQRLKQTNKHKPNQQNTNKQSEYNLNKQSITKSKFIDLVNFYQDFQSLPKQNQQNKLNIKYEHQQSGRKQYNNNKNIFQTSLKRSIYLTGKKGIPFTFSLQNSQSSIKQSTNMKSFVLQKYTNIRFNQYTNFDSNVYFNDQKNVNSNNRKGNLNINQDNIQSYDYVYQ